KGNVLDPIDLVDGIGLDALVDKRTSGLMQPQMAPAIEKATRKEFPDGIPAFGCDALRFTFAALATTGRDIRFDLGRVEGYRNFCNKLWNAARYVLMQVGEDPVKAAGEPGVADRWIRSRLARTVAAVHEHFAAYRLDLAAQALYEFVWNEYCDWYLELTKPVLRDGDEAARQAARRTLLDVLEATLRALHPIMPFITEEIWQRVREPLGIDGEFVMTQPFPEPGEIDKSAEAEITWLQQVLQGVRRTRSELDLPPGKPLPLQLQGGDHSDRDRQHRFDNWLTSLGRLASIEWLGDDADTAKCAIHLVGDLKVLIPLEGLVDVDAELERIARQLERERADLDRSRAKLANERFVDNAPADVVAQERERLDRHTASVEQLEAHRERIARLRD
ncbi:MAG: class I tRNA ligase family protein, partial [Xanthomonadales bacterium]|nr:class I tRNA ligase family protein [Xanthomonadales bacterium]